MKDDKVYIQQILDAVRKIELFTANIDRASFGADEKTQSAVIMQLMLVREISKKISLKIKSSIVSECQGETLTLGGADDRLVSSLRQTHHRLHNPTHFCTRLVI